ncbi:hypothetical protein STCU_01646 [Strigomonas culicis]|uniref:Uncharacterized protein n=1 Tax=Strigomonas culicis TaxID=28005 RepID=S9UZY0_9TRYP|nr:hypothetical protein STCU_01646 [Strigomonas culicis]|eukprot:EPY34324.1 hypothetical protein STCU_01646 [Strigomonas culicis]
MALRRVPHRALRARLHGSHCRELAARVVLVEGDVRVRVEAEQLRPLEGRQRGQVLLDLAERLDVGRDVVDAVLRDVELGRLRHAVVEEAAEDRVEAAVVEEVCHPAAVVDDTDHVAQRVPRHRAVAVRVHVRGERLQAGVVVRLVPLVGDVPAERAESAALLHDRVEVRERQDEAVPHDRVARAAIPHDVRDVHRERVAQVRLEPLRRLLHHLHTGLQQQHGEGGHRHRRQPQAEVLVHILVAQLLENALQRGNPRRVHVAVLEIDPHALRRPAANHLLRLGALVLAERQHELARAEPFTRGELGEHLRRVRTGGQHKHNRRRWRAVEEAALEVEGGALRELLPERLRDDLRHAIAQEVLPHRLEHQQLLPQRHVVQQRGELLVGPVALVPLLPLRLLVVDVVVELAELGDELRQRGRLVPAQRGQPLRRRVRVGVGVLVPLAALEHEAPLVLADRAVLPADAGVQEEGKDELVALEEPAADGLVRAERHGGQQHRHALVHVLLLLRPLQRQREEHLEKVERVLIHVVEAAQLRHNGVHDGAARGDGAVAVTRGLNVLLRLLRDPHGLGDGFARPLRALQRVHELLVVEDVPGGRGEQLQDLVLQLLELVLAVRNVEHRLVGPLLELHVLVAHDIRQELVLQAALRHREVDNGHLDLELREVRRVRQLGGDVQAELRVVVDFGVAQLQQQTALRAVGLAQQHAIEGRVERLLHILQQDGEPQANRVLEGAHVVGIAQLDDAQVVLALHVADPVHRLALRVHTQAPALGLVHDDTILDTECVRWQPLLRPAAHEHRVDHTGELEGVGADRDLQLEAALVPAVDQALAVGGCEGTEVGHEAGGEHNATDEVALLFLQAGDRLDPPRLLGGEAGHDLLRALEPHRGEVDVVLELLLLPDILLHVVLQRRQLRLDRLESPLCLVQRVCRDGHPRLRLREPRPLRLDHFDNVVVVVDREHPHGEGAARLGALQHLVRLELRVRDVLVDRLDHLLG